MPRGLRSSLQRSSLRRVFARVGTRLAVAFALGSVRVLSALPSRWVLKAGDALGSALFYLDPRGRRVARQNLRATFGEGMSSRRIGAVSRASMRHAVRNILLLLHVQPLTKRRYLRWVDCPDIEDAPEYARMQARGGILVSAHVGNWEMLLGARVAYPHLPPVSFLAEAIPRQFINEVLERLRSHPDLRSAFRKGGARAMSQVVQSGGIAAMLVDRNVRRTLGGVYVPFFGRPARTTPLPAWLAQRFDVPVHPIFCLPHESPGRYRLWIGPDLAHDLPPGDDASQQHALLTRMNRVIEDIVRARPELWNWTLKRFKARPTQALDGYPPYSRFDPDVSHPMRPPS